MTYYQIPDRSVYNWPDPSEKAHSLEAEIHNLENSLQEACSWVREMTLEILALDKLDVSFLEESLQVLQQTRLNYLQLLPSLLRFEQDITQIGRLLNEFEALICCFEQVCLRIKERMKFHS